MSALNQVAIIINAVIIIYRDPETGIEYIKTDAHPVGQDDNFSKNTIILRVSKAFNLIPEVDMQSYIFNRIHRNDYHEFL